MTLLDALAHPIVQAPLAGGASTPALAAAVSEAGGLGFLAAGYRDADAVRAFAGTLRGESERAGVALGEPRHDDDGWEAKLALAEAERLPLVTFTFGAPDAAVVERMHAAGAEVWVTVTSPAEARIARDAGADALVVQGVEAGGHRASFDDDAGADLGILAALQLIGAAVDLPLVATGGLATGRAVAAVLAAGATAAQLGTAFMRCPEAGTAAAHRAHARVQRAHGARHRQPLPARALGRRPARVSRAAPPDRSPARGRARPRRRRWLPPVGRASPRARPGGAGGGPRGSPRGRGGGGAGAGAATRSGLRRRVGQSHAQQEGRHPQHDRALTQEGAGHLREDARLRARAVRL